MDGIFISYRREDSSGYAGRLYDRLAARFGRERVFMDVEGIDPGTDFIDAIDSAVASCTVLLVLIGPKWLGDDIGKDTRRIDDPHDFVRLETAAALRRKIRVLPVLVNDAEMPGEAELPPDLKALARRQAIEINHKQWDASTGEVLKALDRIFGTDTPRWRLPAIIATACITLAIGGGLLWLNRPLDDTTPPPPTLLSAAPPAPVPAESLPEASLPATPTTATATAKPPTAIKPSVKSRLAASNSAPKPATPSPRTASVAGFNCPTSRRITRSGGTCANCRTGGKPKASISVRPMPRPSSTGQMVAAGKADSTRPASKSTNT